MRAALPYTKLYNSAKICVYNLDQQFGLCKPVFIIILLYKEFKHVQGISDKSPALLVSRDQTYQN